MEEGRLAAVIGPGGSGSGYGVGGRLVLTSAHVTGPVGSWVEVFHPGGTGIAGGSVVWSGTPKGRDDAALVLVDDSPHWCPPGGPVRWGRLATNRPGTPCETWGVPDEAQRPDLPSEASHPRGEINPGSGFVNGQYVMDLAQYPPQAAAGGASPWSGLSGAAVFSGDLLVGAVAADRADSGHGRLNVVPAHVLAEAAAFRAALAEHGGGPGDVEAVEFQALAERTHGPAPRRGPATPAALLEAGRQIVPFHGRADLLTDLRTWCVSDGFGAWLLHGPGGQGKTRLAHHLGRQLVADGWTVLWPRTEATPARLAEVRHAAEPLLVVLDYAETRTHQLTALVEAAADHPGTTPFKLLLLARTDGDWWQQTRTATRLAADHLTTARTHHLAPLEDTPGDRPAAYHRAAHALAAALPLVDGMTGHDWPAAVAALPTPSLEQDAYANALTLHMTALADLLDTTAPEPARNGPAYNGSARNEPTRNGPASTGNADAPGHPADGAVPDGTHGVEDRLLEHESRYWRSSAAARGLTRSLSAATLEAALAAAHLTGAADRDQADHLWRRLPALADQPRDRRDRVTAWLATLYPTGAQGGPPWGALQPDRLAERHIGRTLAADPRLADHLLDGADDTQTGQLLTVYSRAAAHPVFHRLGAQLTELCVRHHRDLGVHIVTTATQTDHPQPLTAALDTITTDPATPLDALNALYSRFPPASRRLAATAVRLARTITARYRALADAEPDTYVPDLAASLNHLSNRLGQAGQRDEAPIAGQEAAGLYRALAATDPETYVPDLAASLNNLSVRLGEAGRRTEGLAGSEESTGLYRALAATDPETYAPDFAMALNNLSVRLGEAGRRAEALAGSEEAVGLYRALAATDPDAYLPDFAMALSNLSIRLGEVGRRAEGLAAVEEAVTIRRALAGANPDAYLPDLAASLNNLSVRLGEVGRRAEGLAVVEEAVTIRRALAGANPDAYLPDFAMALNNLSIRLGEVGRRAEGLAGSEEATGVYRALAEGNPDAYLPDLAASLNTLSVRLGEVGRRAEGLAAVEEAVTIRRALARANPDAYGPDLAVSLNNLSIRLGEAGRREEGLAGSEEATGLYRALAGANPDAYGPDLAVSLNNLSIRLGEAGRRAEGLAAVEEATGLYRTLAEADPGLFEPLLRRSFEVRTWLDGLAP